MITVDACLIISYAWLALSPKLELGKLNGLRPVGRDGRRMVTSQVFLRCMIVPGVRLAPCRILRALRFRHRSLADPLRQIPSVHTSTIAEVSAGEQAGGLRRSGGISRLSGSDRK